jgi:hypothetical protein
MIVERFVKKGTPLKHGHNERLAHFGMVSVKGKYSREGGQQDELRLLGLKAKVVERIVACLVEREIL